MGPGMVFGAYIIGHIIDYQGIRKATYFIMLSTILEYGLLIIFNEIHEFSFWFACVTSFGIGMIDGVV